MRAVRYLQKHMRLTCALWIALCFALTSAVYLSWVYRLVDQVGAAVTVHSPQLWPSAQGSVGSSFGMTSVLVAPQRVQV